MNPEPIVDPEGRESARIAGEYARRQEDRGLSRAYDLQDPGALFLLQTRERALLRCLRETGRGDLGALDILDVGCGAGGELRRYVGYGADPARTHGVDLLPERIATARRLCAPETTLQQGSATALPYGDASFDLLLLYTVLSSVLDAVMRSAIARECLRVLRPDGAIVWYDFRWNPINRATVGIDRRELQRLFPDCVLRLRRVTLAPPLARPLARRSWPLAEAVNLLPPLRTHDLGLILKPGT